MHHVWCSFLVKYHITEVTQPLQPRFGALQLLAFPKTRITFEREEISDCQWDSGKYDGAAGNWENSVRSQGVYVEGDWGVIVPCAMFLVCGILFSKCLFFSMAGYLLDRPYMYNFNSQLWHGAVDIFTFSSFPNPKIIDHYKAHSICWKTLFIKTFCPNSLPFFPSLLTNLKWHIRCKAPLISLLLHSHL